MSATPEPVALAREVLALAHEDETVTVCTIPDNTVAALARAVLRVKEMAEALEVGALWAINHPDLDDDLKAHAHADQGCAAEILKALNGENHE